MVELARKSFFIDTAIVTKTNSWFCLQNMIYHILSWETYDENDKSKEKLLELYDNNLEVVETLLKYGNKIDKDMDYEKQLIRKEFYKIKEDKTLFICELVTNLLTERNAITIKLEQDVWEEHLSIDTIKKIRLDNIKMPYNAFIVDVSNYKWKYNRIEEVKAIHFGKFIEDEKYVSKSATKGMFTLVIHTNHSTPNVLYLDMNLTLEEHFERGYLNNRIEVEFLLSRLFSIAMYIEYFKFDKSRVIVGKQIVKKNKKKNILSDKQITVIKLKQPISNEIIQRKGFEKSKINVSFLVKGHWRNQSYVHSQTKERYNKPKWIDSFFKGKDKDKLQKIIEINPAK